MKAIVCESPGKIVYRSVPDPSYGTDDVVIRIKRCGICGTDRHIYNADYVADYPIIPGHEFSGEIVEAGKNVQRFNIGDRVTVEPNLHCGKCHFCLIERRNQCLNWEAIGVTRNGAFAEFTTAPENALFHIEDLSFEEAAFVEPVSCCTWGIKNLSVKPGDEALIFGGGAIGLILMQLLQTSGASKVIISDRINERISLAKQLGATEAILFNETSGDKIKESAQYGYDIVVDATGVPAVVEKMIDYVKPGGTLLFFGVCPKDEHIKLNPFTVFKNDLKIVGSFASCATFDPAIKLIQGKKLQVLPLLSKCLKLNEIDSISSILSGVADIMKAQIMP